MQKYLEVLLFKPASKSLDTLKTSADEIFDLIIGNGAIEVMFGIFPEENNIIIFMNEENKDTNEEFINAVEEYEPKIIFYPLSREILSKPETSIDKRSLDIMVLGGDGLYTEIKGCSVGFLATAKNEDKSYIVTADHCKNDKKGDETKFFYIAWDGKPTNELIWLMLILNGINVAVIGNVNSMILPLSMITKYGDVEPITNK
ncbi:14781_t:CDS:2 [Gigaspora margarita]|uniref:14781_t:CDS:1 n=1 Tax=Gigaspora margarita TaxID=4874 RepID=A0ABN7VU08_GIGMA|nr:14781_t:CDS:2 [Gigaspora margarita]